MNNDKVMIDGEEFEVKPPSRNAGDVIEGVCEDIAETFADLGLSDEEIAVKEIQETVKKSRVVIAKSAKGGNKILDRLNGFFNAPRMVRERYPYK